MNPLDFHHIFQMVDNMVERSAKKIMLDKT